MTDTDAPTPQGEGVNVVAAAAETAARPSVTRRAWGWLARHPRLYALAMRVQARVLKSAADERGMIRSLPFASGWTDRRDFPAPEGRTFREMYAEAKSKA